MSHATRWMGALATLAVALGVACEKSPEAGKGAGKGAAPAAKGAAGSGGAGGEAGNLKIAVVPKGTTHDFWKSVHAGALKAEQELGGVTVTFRGPEKEDDRDQQVSLVQNLISAKYDAIVLAPLDDKALVGPVRQAADAKIPVVIIDSGLEAEAGKDFVSFVATDNERGGQLAAERMVASLGGKGKVLLLRYQEGSASTALREKGFAETIAKSAGITLIDPKRYAGATRATAQEASENLLSAYPDIDGVFAPNESSSYGMLLALRGRGMAGKVKFVGFDSSEAEVEALRKGEIDALVIQNPVRMGYLGVKSAVDHIRGRPVQRRIDTGVGIITKDGMDSPESKELLSPDLSILSGKK